MSIAYYRVTRIPATDTTGLKLRVSNGKRSQTFAPDYAAQCMNAAAVARFIGEHESDVHYDSSQRDGLKSVLYWA